MSITRELLKANSSGKQNGDGRKFFPQNKWDHKGTEYSQITGKNVFK
jgi:hypothetical protein